MSSVENLNKIFLQFCDDLENFIPSKRDYIDSARSRIAEKPSTKYYLEYFFRHCLPYATEITSCDLAATADMNVIHGVKISNLVESGLTVSSRHALWRYLHTFYLLVQSYTRLDKVIEKYDDLDDLSKIKEALGRHDVNLKNIMDSSAKFAEELIRDQARERVEETTEGTNVFEGMDEKKFEESFLNSNIGNLAKEISQDLDMNDLKGMDNPGDLMKNLLGGGEAGGLGNIIQKVSTKLQSKLQNGQLNEDVLLKEATQMIGMLGPAMGGGKGGMGGMGDIMSMMGGLMGAGGKKKSKKSSKK